MTKTGKKLTAKKQKILFLHPNFPAQFRHLATRLGKDPHYEVVFATKRIEGNIEGVRKVIYNPSRTARPETHHYVRNLENAVLQGQAIYRVGEQLKKEGFYPDLVYGHSGWGPTLFIKDIFPKTKFLGYFEWFYHAHGSDADFDPNDPLNADDEARIRIKNAAILIDLSSCDRGLCPTQWQKQQFPPEYHHKLTALHDGVDTKYFQPLADTQLILPRLNLDLSQAPEIITYVARGMEPYRGFPQFMETVAILQKLRPQCHVVIVGQNRVAYGKNLPDGQTYKDLMLAKLDLDQQRIHFTGLLPYNEYLQVLQASSVHIYLTRPFVLSWSMLEAMSTGCLIVASKTPPVQEVIKDGYNGFLVDFFSPQEIANKVVSILENYSMNQNIKLKARETIVKNYHLSDLISQHLEWVEKGTITKSKKKQKAKGFR